MKAYSLFFILALSGCKLNHPPGWHTPSQYKNNFKVDRTTYRIDSIDLIDNMKKIDEKGIRPFDGFKSTNFQIDTIVYSNDLRKFMALVIHEYEGRDINTDKPENKYAALCFLGVKENSKQTKIYWFDYMVTGGRSQNGLENLSFRIREMYFNELAVRKPTSCKYNFDDKRVWSEPIWNNYEWINLE